MENKKVIDLNRVVFWEISTQSKVEIDEQTGLKLYSDVINLLFDNGIEITFKCYQEYSFRVENKLNGFTSGENVDRFWSIPVENVMSENKLLLGSGGNA